MSIHKIGSDLIRPSGTRDTLRGAGSSKQSDGEELRRVERADRVEISAEGRDLAARLSVQSETLTESRMATIRDRIASGFYDDPSVAEQVAERLVATGDLTSHA